MVRSVQPLIIYFDVTASLSRLADSLSGMIFCSIDVITGKYSKVLHNIVSKEMFFGLA